MTCDKKIGRLLTEWGMCDESREGIYQWKGWGGVVWVNISGWGICEQCMKEVISVGEG